MNGCAKSELCLFDRPIPQVVVENASFIDVYPIESVKNAQVINFRISGNETDYVDLNNSLLYIRLKVVNSKDGSLITAAMKIAPDNYMFYSLFSDAKLSLNGQLIEGGDGRYIPKSNIESFLNYSTDTKTTQMSTVGYSPDDWPIRARDILNGKELELCGPIRLDFIAQPRYLMPGVDIKLELTKANDKFALFMVPGGDGDKAGIIPIVKILEARLSVRRVKVDPSVIMGLRLGLDVRNAIYPYSCGKVISYAIPKGSSTFYKDMLFGDMRTPKFLVVGIQNTQVYAGSYYYQNQWYEPFGVTRMALSRDTDFNEQYVTDFNNNKVMDAYTKSIIRNLGHLEKNINVGISPKLWLTGTTLYTFNLAPDFDKHQTQLPRDGNLKLEINFDATTNTALNVVVYGVFDTEIQITKDGRVIR